jgi:hypothetical protein
LRRKNGRENWQLNARSANGNSGSRKHESTVSSEMLRLFSKPLK